MQPIPAARVTVRGLDADETASGSHVHSSPEQAAAKSTIQAPSRPPPAHAACADESDAALPRCRLDRTRARTWRPRRRGRGGGPGRARPRPAPPPRDSEAAARSRAHPRPAPRRIRPRGRRPRWARFRTSAPRSPRPSPPARANHLAVAGPTPRRPRMRLSLSAPLGACVADGAALIGAGCDHVAPLATAAVIATTLFKHGTGCSLSSMMVRRSTQRTAAAPRSVCSAPGHEPRHCSRL